MEEVFASADCTIAVSPAVDIESEFSKQNTVQNRNRDHETYKWHKLDAGIQRCLVSHKLEVRVYIDGGFWDRALAENEKKG